MHIIVVNSCVYAPTRLFSAVELAQMTSPDEAVRTKLLESIGFATALFASGLIEQLSLLPPKTANSGVALGWGGFPERCKPLLLSWWHLDSRVPSQSVFKKYVTRAIVLGQETLTWIHLSSTHASMKAMPHLTYGWSLLQVMYLWTNRFLPRRVDLHSSTAFQAICITEADGLEVCNRKYRGNWKEFPQGSLEGRNDIMGWHRSCWSFWIPFQHLLPRDF